MTILYIDPYFLGDPLFLGGFARDLAARPVESPLIVVHGSGEAGERAIESSGAVANAVGGVWQTENPAVRAAIERATRELNRSIVHELNESNVAAVRVLGVDRGLLRAEGDAVGKTGWIETLARQGGVPVVGALGRGADGVVEVDAAAAAGHIARAVGAQAVTALMKGRAASVQNADGDVATLAADALADLRGLPDPDAVRRTLRTGISVRLTSPAGVRSGDSTAGTLVPA